MSYHLEAKTEVGVRSFETFCKALNLPTPEYSKKRFCYTIDAKNAAIYSDKAYRLFSELKSGGCLDMTEVQFLLAETTIQAAVEDWEVWGWLNEGPRQPMELFFC